MRSSSDHQDYGLTLLSALLFVAAISALRMRGWNGSVDDWLALLVLVGSLGIGARLLRRW